MIGPVKRAVSIAVVLGAAALAYAIGNGDIKPVSPVTVVTVTSATGSGSGTATLENTTSATTYNVLLTADDTCDPLVGFTVPSNPIMSFGPMSSRNVTFNCPPRGGPAIRHCLVHATNNANQAPLADLTGVCLYGATPGTLVPQQTLLDFATVTVGQEAELPLVIQHDGVLSQTITRVYLETTDPDGNFRFSTPCNPDAPFCSDELVTPVHLGEAMTIGVRCTPQSPGMHTAQVLVGTDTFQLLSTGVTLQCIGGATTAPVLGANPTNIKIVDGVEVAGGSADVVVHLSNPGGSTIMIHDVRTVDVDIDSASDWTYTATGACTGQITTMCSLDPGETIDLDVKFDPSSIGRRRATLLISYNDSLDRTKEIPLEGTGRGATLVVADGMTSLPFGQVPIGRSAQLELTLLNTGNRDTTAVLELEAGATPPFTISPATMTTVSPGIPEAVTVTCTPAAAESSTTTITATGSDTLTMQMLPLTATCEGTTGELTATPPAVLFGEVRLRGSPIQRTVQIQATGSPLTLSGQPEFMGMTPDVSVGTYSGTTTPATFDVTFVPPSGSATQGATTGSILVAGTAGDTLSIPVAARVVEATYDVATEIQLGTFCVGQATTSSNASLVSTGTATISVTEPTLAMSPSPFQLAFATPTQYPAVLGPAGGAARVAVTAKRQTQVTTVSDTLTWHTDVEDKPTADTVINAQFIDAGAAIAPRSLDFGEVTVHLFTEDGQRVTIQNCNDTPLQLDPPMVRTPFEIESPNFPPMLAPNETVTFSVGFHPTRKGAVTDVLRITSPQLPGEPLEVTLFGFGKTPDDMPPDGGGGSNSDDDTSFYACACSSGHRPFGGLPIVIAVLWVSRRRRDRIM